MILEAAKSIIAATSALVRAASAAQRELIDQVACHTNIAITLANWSYLHTKTLQIHAAYSLGGPMVVVMNFDFVTCL